MNTQLEFDMKTYPTTNTQLPKGAIGKYKVVTEVGGVKLDMKTYPTTNTQLPKGAIGKYKVVTEFGGIKLAEPITVRDGWKAGDRFGQYYVGEHGELRRIRPKADFRTVRRIRRALRTTRNLASGGGSDLTVRAYAEEGLAKIRRWRKEGGSL